MQNMDDTAPKCNPERSLRNQSPEQLGPALEAHIESLGLTGFGACTGDQNGLSDLSTWITTTACDDSTHKQILEQLEDIGLQLFEAPKDDGNALQSTYGIPVEEPQTDLSAGDRVVINEGSRVSRHLITNIEEVTDGGPWSRKSQLSLLDVRRVDTGTEYLMVVDHDQREDDSTTTLYANSSVTASGYAQDSRVESLHRNPRYAELAIESN